MLPCPPQIHATVSKRNSPTPPQFRAPIMTSTSEILSMTIGKAPFIRLRREHLWVVCPPEQGFIHSAGLQLPFGRWKTARNSLHDSLFLAIKNGLCYKQPIKVNVLASIHYLLSWLFFFSVKNAWPSTIPIIEAIVPTKKKVSVCKST